MKMFVRLVIVVAIMVPWELYNMNNGKRSDFWMTFLMAFMAFGLANLVTWLLFDRKKEPVEEPEDIIDGNRNEP